MDSNGKQIKIVVDPLGNPTIEAIGFQDASCEDATKALERAAGGKADKVYKPEFQGAADSTVEQEQRNW